MKFSAIDAGVDRDYRFARWHGEAERHLQASGLAWSIVRPGFFMQNFLMMAESLRAEGRFYLPECEEPIGMNEFSAPTSSACSAASRSVSTSSYATARPS